MWRYDEIFSLDEAADTEEIVAVYESSSRNVAGTKYSHHIAQAALDAAEGRCRLLIWRNFNQVKPFTETRDEIEHVEDSPISYADITAQLSRIECKLDKLLELVEKEEKR